MVLSSPSDLGLAIGATGAEIATVNEHSMGDFIWMIIVSMYHIIFQKSFRKQS